MKRPVCRISSIPRIFCPTTAEKLETEGQSLPYEFLEPNIPSQLDADFISLINSLENEMARIRRTARNRQTNRDRVILVGVTTGYISDAEESMAELEELALSADVVVLDTILQRRPKIDPKTVLGSGKLDELLDPLDASRRRYDRFRYRIVAGTGALAFRCDGSESDRPPAADPRYFCPARPVARR